MKKLVLIPYVEYQRYLSLLQPNNSTNEKGENNSKIETEDNALHTNEIEIDNNKLNVIDKQSGSGKIESVPPGIPEKYTIRKVGDKGIIKSNNWQSQWLKI